MHRKPRPCTKGKTPIGDSTLRSPLHESSFGFSDGCMAQARTRKRCAGNQNENLGEVVHFLPEEVTLGFLWHGIVSLAPAVN